jgi:hypothetical protein
MAKRKGKNKKAKRRRRPGLPAAEVPAWMDDDGLHALLPGTPPDQKTLERMTELYQEQIRNSPMWDEMVREFGPEKAEELLRQCRAELR